jgi:L-threonylcarbamoyladenylate synthase
MLRLVVDPDTPDPETVASAAAHIRRGGVVAYPTDTLYGLGADPCLREAVRRVFAIKGRPDDKPLPLIASSTEAVERIVAFTPLARKLVDHFWPGPLTLLLRPTERIAPEVQQALTLVGIRVPQSVVARSLAAAAGGVVTATSANRSGSEPSDEPDPVGAQLAPYGLDVLLDAGKSPGGRPSTIVDASGDVPVLVRAGAVPWERVLEFVQHGSTAD